MHLITQNLAELCSLLVNNIFGELPSRIFAALLNKGRSSIPQLAQYTSLTPRQLRHGLVVLLQNNLLYFQTESGHAIYTANADAAYNLVRTGKVLDMIGSVYGEPAKEVMQNLLSMGHTKVEHLRDAYEAKFRQAARMAAAANGGASGDPNGFADHEEASEEIKQDTMTGLYIKSLQELDEVLCRMIQAELVASVNQDSFRSWEDTRKLIEDEVHTAYFAGGVRGAKGKEEFASRLGKRLREVRDDPISLKRKLQAKIQMNKRRKLSEWNSANDYDDDELIVDSDIVLRVNYEKCSVELRNQQLVHFVNEVYGQTTAEVYATLLQQLSKKISRCRFDPEVDDHDDDSAGRNAKVSTNEIYEKLDPTLDVSVGIGKISANMTDRKSANHIQERAPAAKVLYEEAEVVGAASSDEEEVEESNGHAYGEDEVDDDFLQSSTNGVNGTKPGKVKFNDAGPAKLSRKEHFRQHLLLLCEGECKFLRHCAMEQWTVDFEPLVDSLQVMELDTVIQRSVGQTGLRVVRILRKVGKMDEKTLPNLALLPKGDVQTIMLKMQMLGYVDMQEVPRDNNRTASRTLFLYWTDTKRCLDRILDNTYKTMLRCLQRLEVQRQMETDVLDLVKRDDVRGHEKEMMQERYYNRFVRVMDIQEKLLAHVMRLDNLVGTLRDF
ncbi:RNA polymerase III subunit RPC82-domain-containing protein [Coniella lustricola]|uniref:DNA-directed RNA polymerase III subunit RPC3 n=1 Tax=Coniella lustricola TaxID=2025994 RepID=A0A2T3A936_9PEZI|nr:RNA polymerase III subunit RPC82-domain-containing protein [Coniella lustricola]